MWKRTLILIALISVGVVVYAQTRGTPSTLRVRIDANGSLVVASAAQVNPVTTVTFNNARLAVDSSGNLLTVISGGSGVGTVTSVAVSSPISTISGPGNPITTTGTITCPTCATVTATLGQFTTTNSATFAGVISNETGFDGANGVLVFNQAPTIITPTITTSLTGPLVIGGTAVGSSLALQSTSGVGTTDFITFAVGSNGGTQAAKIFHTGFWLYGPASTSGSYGTIPAGILHTVSTSGNSYVTDKISADATSAALIGRKARGTVDTPTQTLAADNLMVMIGQGWETTTPGWTSGAIGQIGIQATENFTSTAQGTRLTFNLTPTGSVTAARLLTLSTSGMIFSQNSGTAMAVANVGANSCGTTTATIAGNQTVGEVTVGATAGTQCRVTVPQATTTRFAGSCSNQSTANLCRVVHVSTTQFDLIGTFVAGDVVAYFVASR